MNKEEEEEEEEKGDGRKRKSNTNNTFPQPPDSKVSYNSLLISQFSPLEKVFAFVMGS